MATAQHDPSIQPFTLSIPKNDVDRLKRKLADTRLPPRPIVPDAEGRYGPPYDWAKALHTTWLNDFDWSAHEERMNTAPHYLYIHSPDLQIHFVHARSPRKDAIPLLMVHGWPGSFYEFNQVWGALSSPPNASDPAFHVVVPSLPGFGFSSWPPRSAWTLQDTAAVFDNLMQRLGYMRYMFQGGDWAHWIGRELGSRYTSTCKLVHFNFAPSPLPPLSRRGKKETSDREAEVQRRVDDWLENHMGYAIEMRTRPHTIGFAFNDNPIGIMMFVGEKYAEAAGPENQKRDYWTQHILATASLYYFTDTIMPSMLCYYENVRHEHFAEFAMLPENRITVPFGYTSFYWDTEPSSKRAVERTGNLVFYKGMYGEFLFPPAVPCIHLYDRETQ